MAVAASMQQFLMGEIMQDARADKLHKRLHDIGILPETPLNEPKLIHAKVSLNAQALEQLKLHLLDVVIGVLLQQIHDQLEGDCGYAI